jgi:hypothetical protein
MAAEYFGDPLLAVPSRRGTLSATCLRAEERHEQKE